METVAGPRYIMTLYVVQHPVQEFFDTWEALQISRRLGVAEQTGAPVSMEDFFRAPSRQRVEAALRVPLAADELRDLAPHGFCGQLLLNRLACRMGLDFEASTPNSVTAQWCVVICIQIQYYCRAYCAE